ncbi:MAG: hypothetical protein ACYTFU_11155 [Planctomycetota bacterium]|jgi:hypothetical protein
MSSKKIQEVVDRFVAEIVGIAEDEALDRVQKRLGEALSVPVKLPKVKRRKSTKGRSILRPCPIKSCKRTAAPRWQMVCQEHSESLSREEILLARDVADKPGGVWFQSKKWKKKTA